MSKQQFAEILKNPYNLDYDALLFLEELRDKYPYSQTVQILLAKCYQKNNSPYFEKQVNIASAYSIDRQQFQNYISEKITVDKSQEDSNGLLQEDEKPVESKFISDDEKPASTSEKVPSLEERTKQLEEIVQKRIDSFKKKKTTTAKKQTPVVPSKVTTDETKNKKNSRPDDLIEKFIRDEPRITPPKDFKPIEGDLSSESVKFNDDIISETLAEIYLKQRRIRKSLDIYYRLSLKFPEKSSYFAKKIEQIKKT